MAKREIVDTVWNFMDRAGDAYAKMIEDRWRQEMHSNCLDCGMQSPIEDLFWIAIKTMCEAEYESFNPSPSHTEGGVKWPFGVHVKPQFKIGTYTVDFLISREPMMEMHRCQPVIVELDGHAFHDKDKKQRAYEKGRDRYLVKHGYRVLHYTGSEIVADPFRAAHEVLVMLLAASCPVYDPKDPLGRGE
jgi:very-short-patch-repair endonuclease